MRAPSHVVERRVGQSEDVAVEGQHGVEGATAIPMWAMIVPRRMDPVW